MITLTPAYGKDYKSKKACLTDFDNNKDFILNDFTNIYDGKPCNKSDLKGQGMVKIRYKSLMQVFTITL